MPASGGSSMRLHVFAVPFLLGCACTCSSESRAQTGPATQPAAVDTVAGAFAELVAAKDWKEAAAARNKLKALGDAALPALLEGAAHPGTLVRQYSHEVLREKFPTEPRAVEAFLRGLEDA